MTTSFDIIEQGGGANTEWVLLEYKIYDCLGQNVANLRDNDSDTCNAGHFAFKYPMEKEYEVKLSWSPCDNKWTSVTILQVCFQEEVKKHTKKTPTGKHYFFFSSTQ